LKSAAFPDLGLISIRLLWDLFIAGGATGVALGAYNYATVKPEIPLDTVKLKLNRLLNQMGE
jgi:hypothetical protein